MPPVGSLSDLLTPFEASKEWADKQEPKGAASTPTTDPKVEMNPERGTHLTNAGWIVLGVILVGGTFLLARHALTMAMTPAPRFRKAGAT